jgi:tetratricopeptide (TPR) repeat protein
VGEGCEQLVFEETILGRIPLNQIKPDNPLARASYAAAPTTPDRASVEQGLGKVVQHANGGMLGRAWEICQQIDAAHPDHPGVQQMLAVLCMQKGDLKSASVYFKRSLALRPDHVPTLIGAGDAARFSGVIEESLAYYARACVLQPDRSEICLMLGSLQHQSGQYQTALQTLERGVQLAPNLTDMWFYLALVRQDLCDLCGAISALKILLTLSPDRVDALVNLGILLQDTGRIDEAMHSFGRAYRLKDSTFGRIANALAAGHAGRIWLNLEDLRSDLLSSPA